jgi:threonine synthase
MRYRSTRGTAPELSFTETMLAGLASDGGLYVPCSDARYQISDVRKDVTTNSYAAKAAALMQPFVGDEIPVEIFAQLVRAAYATFTHAAVAPLVQLDDRLWLLELFHGPTLAFKDIAMQLLGQLFTHVLGQNGQRLTIVAATSGDTGAAAVEAFKNHPYVDLFILLPQGRISAVQQRQMTTAGADNVHVIAVEGTFDDCQQLVKALFADLAFRAEANLSAVNSINWVRIMAQMAYYAISASALGANAQNQVRFSVPTGNFGNIYAAHMARAMGVPIRGLLIGTNANDALVRLLGQGQLQPEVVMPTLSPAMDIQIPSNLERLLFELYDQDGTNLAADMVALRSTGRLALSPARLARAQSQFKAARIDDPLILQTIAEIHAGTGQIIDPHTAVGIATAKLLAIDGDCPTIALATAHPAKFPEAVQRAIGRQPPVPEQLAILLDRPEIYTTLAPRLDLLQTFIRDRRQ